MIVLPPRRGLKTFRQATLSLLSQIAEPEWLVVRRPPDPGAQITEQASGDMMPIPTTASPTRSKG